MNTRQQRTQVLKWLANEDDVQCRVIGIGEWKNFPMACSDDWSSLLLKGSAHNLEFRLNPRTITVNGREVQAGVEVEPDGEFYIASPVHPGFHGHCFEFCECIDHKTFLRRGLIHLTKEAAIAHAKAMLNID